MPSKLKKKGHKYNSFYPKNTLVELDTEQKNKENKLLNELIDKKYFDEILEDKK